MEETKNKKKHRKIKVGDTFGRLTVIAKDTPYIDKTGHHFGRWLCQCSCEDKTIVSVITANLTCGTTQSCGCLIKEKLKSVKFDKEKGCFVTINPNTYDLTGEYGIGTATTGETFYFDKEDYDLIKDYSWYVKKDERGKEWSYVVANNPEKTPCFIRLHRLVTHCPPDKVVDHFNHNTLDNRKENLRICERAENSQSQRLRPDNTSGHKGVYWDKSRNKWMANIMAFGQYHYLGRYEKYEDAVAVREAAEEKYFKEFNYKPQETNKK